MLATLIAGSLDMLGAILVYDVFMHRVTAAQILLGIAAALFGKTIIVSEAFMALIGLLLHYFITFCFVVTYILIYPRIYLIKKNTIISGLVYGIFVWFIMNIIVVPIATGRSYTFLLPAFLRQVITLMVCIGLPVAFITARYYFKRRSFTAAV